MLTHEQFTFWLRGFLEDKKSLTQKDLEVIKLQMAQVYDMPFYNSFPTTCQSSGSTYTTINPTGYYD